MEQYIISACLCSWLGISRVLLVAVGSIRVLDLVSFRLSDDLDSEIGETDQARQVAENTVS